MNKTFYKLILFLVMAISPKLLLAQNVVAYNDAKFLYETIKINNGKFKLNDDIKKLFKNYIPEVDDEKIKSAIQLNPFLKNFLNPEALRPDNEIFRTKTFKNLNSLTTNNISGLDVTDFSNALSAIMIEHAKEELTASFFKKFKQFTSKNQEFQILFPKTTATISGLLSYRYTEMLSALQESFLEDLNKLVFRINDVLQLEKYRVLFKEFPEIRLAAESIKVIHELEVGYHTPNTIITRFASLDFWNDADIKNNTTYKNIHSSLNLANLLSNSLLNTKSNSVWISMQDIRMVLQDQVLFKLYLGLLYEQVKTDTDNSFTFYTAQGSEIKLLDLMKKHEEDINFFTEKLSSFLILLGQVEEVFKELKNNQSKITNDDIYKYITLTIDLTELSCGIASNFTPSFKPDQYLKALRISNDIYKSVYKKEYNTAISQLFNLFETLNITPEDTKKKMYRNTRRQLKEIKISKNKKEKKVDEKFVNLFIATYSISPVNSVDLFANYTQNPEIQSQQEAIILEHASNLWQTDDVPEIKNIISVLQQMKQEFEKKTNKIYSTSKSTTTNKFVANEIKSSFRDEIKTEQTKDLANFIKKARPYAIFIANMANAKTEDDVKKVLESAVLPVGSSRIKKYSKLNFNVQSYLGARYGQKDADYDSSWNKEFWVSAPVGLSVTTGLKKYGYAGLFVPLIDLGAIVDYQIKQDENNSEDRKVEYKIELGQIFSPGAYLVYGFPANIPLTFGIGYQYGPGLVNIKEDDNDKTTVAPYWRWGAFLAVDIPLFNFSNKPLTSME